MSDRDESDCLRNVRAPKVFQRLLAFKAQEEADRIVEIVSDELRLIIGSRQEVDIKAFEP